MRYTPRHKEDTRARLLDAAGALIKQRGFAATGVDGLMAAAGLTSGAFYSHFRSKGELLEAVVERELDRSIALFSGTSPEQMMSTVEAYLSADHVRHPGTGCVVPALAPEIARAGDPAQRAFEQGVVAVKERIGALVDDEGAAWSIIAQLVGAVMMARGLPTEARRQALLQGVAQQIGRMLAKSPDPAHEVLQEERQTNTSA